MSTTVGNMAQHKRGVSTGDDITRTVLTLTFSLHWTNHSDAVPASKPYISPQLPTWFLQQHTMTWIPTCDQTHHAYMHARAHHTPTSEANLPCLHPCTSIL